MLNNVKRTSRSQTLLSKAPAGMSQVHTGNRQCGFSEQFVQSADAQCSNYDMNLLRRFAMLRYESQWFDSVCSCGHFEGILLNRTE